MELRTRNGMDALKFLAAISVVVAGYCALSPVIAWPLYNLVLFPPNQSAHYPSHWVADVELTYATKVQPVRFPNSEGSEVVGWYFDKPGAKRVCVYSHGRGIRRSNRLTIIKALLASNISVLDYDYVGTGATGGEASIAGTIRDAIAAYDYLIEHRGWSPSEVMAYGQSFGVGPTTSLSKHRRLAGVVLQSSYSSLLAVSREWFPSLRLYGDDWFPMEKFDIVSAMKSSKTPLLLLAGTKDKLIGSSHSSRIFAAATGKKTLVRVDGAGHNVVSSDFVTSTRALTKFNAEI